MGLVGADATPRNQPLRAELRRMADRDQAVRVRAIKNPSDAYVAYEEGYADGVNTCRMKQIIARYGWPGKSLVGADGAANAWLLVQHADRDRPFQASCLTLMQKAAARGEADPGGVALLTDRVRLHGGKKQVYGTQFQSVREGEVTFKPIEDVADVDKRRKAVGLPTLAEYRRQIVAVYGRNYGAGAKKAPPAPAAGGAR
jgi:hypothetical protein